MYIYRLERFPDSFTVLYLLLSSRMIGNGELPIGVGEDDIDNSSVR